MCLGTLFAQKDLNSTASINLSSLKSPFVNPTFEQLKQIKISAIVFNRVKIGDNWYEEGDKIGDAFITKINAKELKIRYDKVEIIIKPNKNDKIDIN